MSCRASDQEWFTRLKTLAVDYAEDAITARIAGRSRPSRQPKPRERTISLKQAARTMNFLTKHGINSYEELESRLGAVTEKRDSAHAPIKETETRIAELSLVMKHSSIYRQLKPVYDRYRQSRDKEKLLRGHEIEIILFEAAARGLKKLDTIPLPSTERIERELAELTARKDSLLAEYRAARNEVQEYETINQNVDALIQKSEKDTRTMECEIE